MYHVSEHLHACARQMHGQTDQARSWAQERLDELIADGGPRFIAKLDERIRSCGQEPHHLAMSALRTYMQGNRDRRGYADRLREGKAIGSGAIEGACKKIGSRLKLNNARSRTRRAERFGALFCLEYTDQMETYWKSTPPPHDRHKDALDPA